MTRIMPMQMLMTLVSRVNKSRIVPPKFKTIKLRKRLVTAARPRQMRTLFLIRSYFPAPKFCPAKVVMETP